MRIDSYEHVLVAHTKNCLLFALFSEPDLEFPHLAGGGLGGCHVVLGSSGLWLKSRNGRLASCRANCASWATLRLFNLLNIVPNL